MKKEIDIESILKEFYTVSACRVALLDPDYNEIALYPIQGAPLCKAVYAHTQPRLVCLREEHEHILIARRTQKPSIYQDHLGLMRAIAPLYGAGVLTGYLVIGQIAEASDGTRDEITRRACAILTEDGANTDGIPAAVAALPAMEAERFSSFVTVMQICMEHVSQSRGAHPPVPALPQSIRQYVFTHHTGKVTLDELCAEFLCSKSTLMNSFRTAYGKTIIRYLTEVRVTHAQRLLIEDGLSMRQIAIMCGFGDQGYFTRVFESAVGVSPTAFRRFMQDGKGARV